MMWIRFSEDRTVDQLPVSPTAGGARRTVYRTVTPGLNPGDVLDCDGRMGVESRLPYVVGVGAGLWARDIDGDQVWFRIGRSTGDNVTAQRHHMPLACAAVWTVPDGWTPGHRAAVAVMADAHSVYVVSGDELGVHDYGEIRVRCWT